MSAFSLDTSYIYGESEISEQNNARYHLQKITGDTMMQIEETKKEHVHIVYLSGRLDNPAAHELVKKLTALIEFGEQNVLLNFENLTYISSSGLRALTGATQRMERKEGQLFLCSLKGLVKRVVVDITHFDKVFTIYETEEDALQHF
jgi:anti-anti-sigma factor